MRCKCSQQRAKLSQVKAILHMLGKPYSQRLTYTKLKFTSAHAMVPCYVALNIAGQALTLVAIVQHTTSLFNYFSALC